MKIYTKSGDTGTTSLFGGKRVNKDDAQIEAYGTIDELNAFIGSLIAQIDDLSHQEDILKKNQAILFDIGSHLASDGTADSYLPELEKEIVLSLENEIDNMTSRLPKLKSFILPGGNDRIASTHLCRVVCRRAERRVITLSNLSEIDDIIIKYLNRLSDYFFTLSRFIALNDGIDEVKWNPK